MEDFKEKLLTGCQDGVLDNIEVIEKLLSFLDEDQVAELIEDEGWGDLIGVRTLEDYEDD